MWWYGDQKLTIAFRFFFFTAHYAGDLNETFFVGNVDEASRQLVHCTYKCLEKAISIGKHVFSLVYFKIFEQGV